MNQTMWIRVKKDGFIYPYDDILAKNPSCEVVTEQVAFPHKFITPEVKEAIAKHTEKPTRGRPRKAPLDLSTPVPETPVYNPPELGADAAKGLPT